MPKLCTKLKQVWNDYKLGRQVRHEMLRGREPCNDDASDRDGSSEGAPRRRQGWQHRPNEKYPWRIERVVPGGANWTGTWILEVKDLFEVEWEKRQVFDGRKWKWESIPQCHWPFPHESKRRSSHDAK